MMNNASQPTVLLFAGQGNPVIGMGSDLWDLTPVQNISGIVPAIFPD
ncbi:malonyl CoA-acyl carrier protein transacylase [Escherichia coli]|nr:malonyl CoA-acyl carrier protein transacylase [Escherichia coli]